MPPVIGVIGAVVGAIGSAVSFVAAGFGLAGVIGATAAGIVGTLAITAGLSLIGKLLHPTTGPPPARGSVTKITVQSDAPQGYPMGEGLIGGALRHDTAYGATLNDVPNPYRWMVIDYGGGGPVESITPYVDQKPIDSYYSGFLYTTTQLGACPESAALTPHFAGAPGWDGTSKISGQAVIGWNLKFDRDGKVFASGVPQLGAYGKWVKVYDPRKDSTFPGGSGAHRLGDETTYEWSENAALHAGQYAFGRFQNGKRTIGVGLDFYAIDYAVIAAWANVCDANNWRMFGIVYEPDDRWQNLKDIAAAGGGMPVIAGGILSFYYQTPRVSVATITEADIGEDVMQATGMRSYRDRINTVSPKYRDPDSNWELVNAADVAVSSYVTEDGEVKKVEWPFNFVKDVDQATQLARYVIEDSRELQPIELSVGPHLRALRPGEAVDLDIPQLGLDTKAVILRREFDPIKLTLKLTMIGETDAKHAFALGETGTPPPTPALAMSGASRDDIRYGADRVPAEPDADVTSTIDGLANIDIAADYTGAVAPSLLPVVKNYKLIRNGVDVTTSAVWSVTVNSGTISASIGVATGVLSLTASGGSLTSAIVTITATYLSTTRTRAVTITRVNGSPPSGGGGGGTSASTTVDGVTVSSTSFAAISSAITVTAGSGGTVDLSAPYAFIGVSNGDLVHTRWYQDISGTYTAIGSDVTAVQAYANIGEYGTYPGYGGNTYQVTGLTPGNSYSFKLYGRLDAGSGAPSCTFYTSSGAVAGVGG